MALEVVEDSSLNVVEDVSLMGLVEQVQAMNPAMTKSFIYKIVGEELGVSARCVEAQMRFPAESRIEDLTDKIYARLIVVLDDVKEDRFAYISKIKVKSEALERFLRLFGHGNFSAVCRHVGMTSTQRGQVLSHPTVSVSIETWEAIQILWAQGGNDDFPVEKEEDCTIAELVDEIKSLNPAISNSCLMQLVADFTGFSPGTIRAYLYPSGKGAKRSTMSKIIAALKEIRDDTYEDPFAHINKIKVDCGWLKSFLQKFGTFSAAARYVGLTSSQLGQIHGCASVALTIEQWYVVEVLMGNAADENFTLCEL